MTDRKRMVIGLASAVVVGIITSVFVYSRLRGANFHPSAETVTIAAAASYLPAGAVLEAKDVKAVQWPDSAVLKGMCEQPGACLGRVLSASVAQGQPILEANLAPKGAGAGLAATIPVGLRAISVPVNDVTAVAGFVLPGTMVDVLLTGQVQQGGTQVGLTRTILEDVRVLAVGRSMEQRPESGKPETLSVVTLQVTPEQADKLAMASAEGRIQLALRNRVDSQIVSPPPVYRSNLFGVTDNTPPRSAVKADGPLSGKPPVYTVEVIRGNHRVVQSFPENGKNK
ncbi:MAG: Flp pilus assembly protein CpaB [Terriglobia bacterium]